MSSASSQAAFAAALLDPSRPVPDGVISHRGDADPKRFSVYRNNVHVGLVGVIAAKYPVCAKLVGDDFFTAMARLYVADHKPASPIMMVYAADFADFITAFEAARSVPYLADVARLEELWSVAYNAADQMALTIADLAALAPEDLADLPLILHPATGLIRSRFPVGSIWSAHHSGDPVGGSAGETVLVSRPEADVRVTVIPPADAVFFEQVRDGASIGAAAAATMDRHADFDFGRALVGLCSLGAFSTLSRKV